MPVSARDLDAYRRDERLGGKLLTPDERIKLLKPYLPSPHRTAPSTSKTREGKKPRLGVRRFLKRQFYVLIFTIIHAVFSLYIRLRQAYHAVGNCIYSIYYYHHRTPELIQRDVKGLGRLPNHLSVILTLEDHKRDGTEKLIDEAANIAAWCASAGIPHLSIYEKTGILKKYMKKAHRATEQKLQAYFGPNFPTVSLGAPYTTPFESAAVVAPGAGNDVAARKHLSVLLLSERDGRETIVDLTKTLTEMSQRKNLSTTDITMELVDTELSENIMGEPDLLVLFGPHVELAGYPPWQIRLTEIFHVQDNQGVGYQVFYRALCKYARAQMRMGR
ncbi:ditrans,polycis-polyprenyl diphosphate synthase [(2E,6E)-farnesyldiphosphate specific] [Madurella fahalii]|uniref:ditrans,polycis-polyprenyl diphosphate synthase [(2E,6E)-farnesyldiphosphate specific] n=1 Tax=Madurella fahalii TaxID=1157608 RepID=A0ABQ0G034_9PEZI